MRFKTELMFKLLKVVKKIGILDEVKGMFKTVKGKTEEEISQMQEELGMDIVLKMVMGLTEAEDEFYEVIASIKEIDQKQARELDFEETIEILKELFRSEVFKGFLSLLSK
ncbi:hypothetical protein KQI86_16695 [Clostridium sp. MSJ-11]|uniref:Uncharacterized protein n=1 Tax=Clostridium mobile TaxID=2841512 RepID=A0ABS6EL75_9CLOT|nr:hypothetical protein [Clostridium mobile]MBU5485961.1 hypothetical protein [Clostridium mobile]